MLAYIRSVRVLPAVLFTAALVLVGATLLPKGVLAAGPYNVPPVSEVRVAIPPSILTTGETILCLVRSNTSGDWVTSRRVCYGSEMPAPAPPPPPPPYEEPVNHEIVISFLDQGSGQLTSSTFPCIEVITGEVAVSVDLNIQLVKGSGTSSGFLTITIDTTPPLTCTDGAQIVGPATLTPLPNNNDWDGDSCTDWDELEAEIPGGGDPFNPNDCSGVGPPVGGIAELPEVAGIPLETPGSSGVSIGVLAGIATATAVGALTLGGAAWYGWRRRLR